MAGSRTRPTGHPRRGGHRPGGAIRPHPGPRLARAARRSGGAALPAADVHAINELAAAAPAIRLLGTRPGQHLTRPVTRADQATRLCADIAAAAIDLLTGPDAATVALCDAPGCGQLYLRGRPNQQCRNPTAAPAPAPGATPSETPPSIPAEPVTGQGRSESADLASLPPHTGQQATRTKSAFRAHCPSVTSRRGHSPWRWPARRGVTAAVPPAGAAHAALPRA